MNPKEILAYLFKVMESDQEFHSREESYIQYVANELGMIEAEVEDVRQNYKSHKFDPPRDEQSRMITLYYILFMMRADRVVTPEEITKVRLYGFSLGFNELLTDDLIKVMIDYANEKLPANIMVEKVKPYLN